MFVYTTYAIISNLPPHFEWQRNILVIGQIILGAIEFSLRFLLLGLGADGISWQCLVVAAVLYIIGAGYLVGRLTQTL
jgi:hypothetical protein